MIMLSPRFTVPCETLNRLENYKTLLIKWQERINLVGSIENIWERHFLDSAQLYTYTQESPEAALADLGSGAGFPGLVLAILGMQQVSLVESDARKVAFLREAARITETRVTLCHQRIETIDRKFDIITARALTALSALLAHTYPLMRDGAFCLFPKGENYSIEIKNARKAWDFDAQVFPSRIHPGGVILMIRNLRLLRHE